MFHGTSAKAIDAIIAEGFKIGGISGPEGVPLASGPALFGHGVYLSEDPDYAQGYIRDAANYMHDGALRLLFAKCFPSADTVRIPDTGASDSISRHKWVRILSTSDSIYISRRHLDLHVLSPSMPIRSAL
jgi:hypothetical protein